MSAEAHTQNKVFHSPLLRFRQRAHCKNCELHNACKVDKLLELRCILTLIADSLHTNTQLNTLRSAHP